MPENPDRPSWGSADRLQDLANLAAIVVALAAIGLAIWQGFENRRFYRLSVLPHLEPMEATWGSIMPIDSDFFLLPQGTDSVYALGYSVENTGLGPAVLDNFLVYHGTEEVFNGSESGKRYLSSDVKADLERLPFPTFALQLGYSAGKMLGADEVHHLITVGVPAATVNGDTLERPPLRIVKDEVLETYSFVFCYCSVYGTDCDMAYLGSAPPVENVCRF